MPVSHHQLIPIFHPQDLHHPEYAKVIQMADMSRKAINLLCTKYATKVEETEGRQTVVTMCDGAVVKVSILSVAHGDNV